MGIPAVLFSLDFLNPPNRDSAGRRPGRDASDGAMRPAPTPDDFRLLLCDLGLQIRETLARHTGNSAEDSRVVAHTAADTIFAIDRIGEEPIGAWFQEHWPREAPVECVMEGIEDSQPWTFPRGIPVSETLWKCIIDPIDGTRGLMYDKRSAWALAAVAPQRGPSTRLRDIVAGAMTELPTSKQHLADQISGVRGCAREGIIAERQQVGERNPTRNVPLHPRPSQATDFTHGFAGLAKFFPEGRVLTAQIEEDLWRGLGLLGSGRGALVFDDEYLSSGGQFYELIMGHDRMQVDLRPLVYPAIGLELCTTAHPYDVCTAFLMEEAGVVVEDPRGWVPLDGPLDTTSPVAWAGFANSTLADLARPLLRQAMERLGVHRREG